MGGKLRKVGGEKACDECGGRAKRGAARDVMHAQVMHSVTEWAGAGRRRRGGVGDARARAGCATAPLSPCVALPRPRRARARLARLALARAGSGRAVASQWRRTRNGAL